MRVHPLFAFALLAPALAAAQPPPAVLESGPIFALRAGYGVPSGDVAGGGPALADLVESKIPIGFELGYRLTRRFWVELQFELAPASPASALCEGGTACSASDARIGAELVIRLLPGAWLDPWLGVGAGAEVLNAEGRDPATGARIEWSWAGLELPFVEVGADLSISERIALGPWASLTFTRFTSESAQIEGGGSLNGGVASRAVHRWLSGGLRATLKL